MLKGKSHTVKSFSNAYGLVGLISVHCRSQDFLKYFYD